MLARTGRKNPKKKSPFQNQSSSPLKTRNPTTINKYKKKRQNNRKILKKNHSKSETLKPRFVNLGFDSRRKRTRSGKKRSQAFEQCLFYTRNSSRYDGDSDDGRPSKITYVERE